MLHRQTARLADASQDIVGPDRITSGILGGIHVMEHAIVATAKELRASRFVDRSNASDASAAARELDGALREIETVRATLEDAIRETAVPLKEAREKAWELRTICEGARRPNVDCRALVRTFPESELASWTKKDAVEQAAMKVEHLALKDAATARDIATVKVKLDAAAVGMSKLDEMQAKSSKPSAALMSHMNAAKEALDRLEQRCGSTKLPASDWVAAPTNTDPRKLVVLVYGLLPEPMRPIFDPKGTKPGDLTSGTTGSGAIVVRKVGGERRAFIVTNRHVVTESSRTKVASEGSDELHDASVLYVDPHHDIAVLEVLPDKDGKVPFDSGVSLDLDRVADQQTVVAVGFPGMGGRPSYQVTRGYVSNREVRVGGGDVTAYIQHTAPIDAGSSGGPLLSERGQLLGVNTLKLRGREAVALSVPAEIVVDALRAAESVSHHVSDAREARLACLSTLGDVSKNGSTAEAGRHLSSAFVAEAGPPYLARHRKTGTKEEREALAEAHRRDPLATLRWAALRRLQDALRDAGGVSDLEMCEGVTMEAGGEVARFIIQTLFGPRELKMVRERGDWTVATFDFRDAKAK